MDEWSETIIEIPLTQDDYRGLRGGDFAQPAFYMRASPYSGGISTFETGVFGFRVAMIPEPTTGLLLIAGLLGLAGWRKVRT